MPGSRSPAPRPSGIAPAAVDRLELHSLRAQGFLHRTKEALGLGRIVGRVVAYVDVDGHEAVLGPGVNGKVRFGQQNRPCHSRGRELMKAVADNAHSRRRRRAQTQRAQGLGLRHLRHLGRATVPFSEQVYAVHFCSPEPATTSIRLNSVLLPKTSAWAIILPLYSGV